MIRQKNVDWVTLTSSAIAENVQRLFGEALHENTKAVSISPTTTAAAESVGLAVAATANEASLDGLVNAIVRAVEG